MSKLVSLSIDLFEEASKHAKMSSCSIEEQIEHWVKIGKVIEENPTLPYSFIRDTLSAEKEINTGKISKFEFKK